MFDPFIGNPGGTAPEPDGLGFQPRVKEPETSGVTGQSGPLAAFSSLGALSMPDTSIGPVALQEPPAWAYDFDPASGVGRASFPGEVWIAGAPIGGGPTTGTGAQVLQVSPAITTPAISGGSISGAAIAGSAISGAAGSFTTLAASGLISPASAIGIAGTIAGNNVQAGSVGEYITAAFAAQALTTAVNLPLGSITLTPGDWDVFGNVQLVGSSQNLTNTYGWISTNGSPAFNPTSGSLGYSTLTIGPSSTAAVQAAGFALSPVRINVTAATPVYLTASATFPNGTATGQGTIAARRVR